jgi:hypothetical protein
LIYTACIMRRFIQKFSSIFLPILVFLTISTLFWQKIDDYNSEISKKFYRLEIEANGEQMSSSECGFGLVQVNSNIQNIAILLLSFGFLSLLFKKKCSKFFQYFPIVLSIFLVFIFNIFLEFFRFNFYHVLNSKELGFYSRYTTLADLCLLLLYPAILLSMIPHLYYFAKGKFQAKISLR